MLGAEDHSRQLEMLDTTSTQAPTAETIAKVTGAAKPLIVKKERHSGAFRVD